MTLLNCTEGYPESVTKILERILGRRPKILKTTSGKPYVEGDPLFFSVSHSGGKAVVAVSERPVGVDLEIYSGKPHSHILSRFSPEEREKIKTDEDFFDAWTAKEAFFKMTDGNFWDTLPRTKCLGGEIFLDGEKYPCTLVTMRFSGGVVSVCERTKDR